MSSINRYLGVECGDQGHLVIKYWLDFAELPAYAELEDLDANRDDAVSPEEQQQYLARRLPPLVAGWTIAIDDQRAEARVTGSRLEIYEGERGLSALRIAADVEVERPASANPSAPELRVFVRDPAFADRPGWREVAADDSANAIVVSGPIEHSKDALAYGNPGHEAAPRVDRAEFTFRLVRDDVARPTPPGPGPIVNIDPRLARLASALKDKSGSPGFVAFAVALAALLGAAHALSPGHGKVLAAATLVGHRARPTNAIVFGVSVAASHTIVVLLLGAFAIAIERTVGSDRVMRGLELAAAVSVAGLGLVQLTSRWKELTTDSGGFHSHAIASPGYRGSLAAIGALSGLAPCPTALAVWLSAVALHRAALGLLLVAAFSLGVATTLTTVGLAVVVARRLLIGRAAPPGILVRLLPVVSSACVAGIGILLCVSAWSADVGRP
jgi:ABC-type nickel/cobalt efflux system permease component RcnA